MHRAVTAVMLIMTSITASAGAAQGSRPRSSSTVAVEPLTRSGTGADPSKTTISGTQMGEAVRVRGGGADPDVVEAEFRDDRGRVARTIRLDGVSIFAVIPSTNRRYVAVIGKGQGHGSERPEPWFDVRYYDRRGRELWRVPLCCAKTDLIWTQVVLSDDGSVVALLDSWPGRGCEMGDGDSGPVIPGCMGLRVLTARGEEVYRSGQAERISLSPHGRYSLVSLPNQPTFLLDHELRKRHDISVPSEGGAPWSVDDTGVVHFSSKDGWFPPDRERFLFIPGKGLERLPHSAQDRRPEP